MQKNNKNIPQVSFVVPCHKLAHLLPECINSILLQTYEDFEILIMDDCSPDNTPEVAGSFKDPRVRHIRNDQNLGHLHNYNKGIELSRGKYIWLISADDRLREPYLLERYVRVMDDNPAVGYACCPAIKLEKGIETTIEKRLVREDRIFKGKEFLIWLLKDNCVIAASGMVRRTCYEKCGTFPVDLPYAGDWFLWCLFALHYDVAYFAEPMVNYRAHESSMTNYLMNSCSALALREGFTVLWRIRKHAQQIGDARIVERCMSHVAYLYGIHLAGGKFENWMYRISEEDFETSLGQEIISQEEKNWIRARAWAVAGDFSCIKQNFDDAREYYKRVSQYDRRMISVRAKQFLFTNALVSGLAIKLFKLKSSVFR
ncbi:MAG TPA: glycosyltransferase [Candidatus Methylomirabilis sp.]|nr:glycosyltransferase [Candidatus Methylomirabilis sp.]